MPKKSVLGHPDNVPSLAREGFSLDQVFTFTASCGQLLPVWHDLLNPGETLKGSPNFLLRTDAFLAPAMADIDCYCDLFFVPMQKILSSFGEWFYQIDDIRTDFVDLQDFTEYLPICVSHDSKNPFAGFTKTMFDHIVQPDEAYPVGTQRYDSFGFGLYRLMYHFGYNPQSIFYGLWKISGYQDEAQPTPILDEFRNAACDLSCPNFSPYLFAAYQGIYYDYYRNSEFEANEIKAYNLDSVFNDGTGEIDLDLVLQSPVYGRGSMFQLRYRYRGRDYFTATRATPLINSVSMMPGYAQRLNQVNQWLAQGTYSYYDPSYASPNDLYPGQAASQMGFKLPGVNALQLSGEMDISSGTPDNYDDVAKIFGRSDGVQKAAFGVGADGTTLVASNPVGSLSGTYQLRQSHLHSSHVDFDNEDVDVIGSYTNVLTTARLRTMFALEKLARVTQRAGKHYDDQTLAHFGFKVNKGLSGEVYKIGSWHTTVGLQKVTSMAATDDAPLGEQAAVGYAVLDGSNKGFKFTAPCHGVVMAIWSCAPRYKYIFTVDKLGFKTKLWDFFKPSLDNLGAQPLFGYEQPSSSLTAVKQEVNTAVYGWQWRFMESKVKFNRVSPVFATVSKNPWSMTSLPETYLDGCGKVAPIDLNRLIDTQYDPAPLWPEQGTQQDRVTDIVSFPNRFLRDPFTVDFYMDVTKVSTMSTFGDTPLNGL